MEKTTNKSNKATFLILAAVAFIMIVVSFFLPPTGVIHPSVIKGAVIMLGFAALTYVPDFINAGTDIQFKHKDPHVTISNPDPKA